MRLVGLLVVLGALVAVPGCYSSSFSKIADAPDDTYAGRSLVVSAVVHGVTKPGKDLTRIWIGGADDDLPLSFDFVEVVKSELRNSIQRKLEGVRFVSNLEIGIPDAYDASFRVEQHQDYLEKIGLDGLFVIEFSSLEGLCSNTMENIVTASLFLPLLAGYLIYGVWVRVVCEIHVKATFTVEFYDVKQRAVTHAYSFFETDVGGCGTRNPGKLTGAHLKQAFQGFAGLFDTVLSDFPR